MHALRNLDEEKINYELAVELLEKIVQTTAQDGAILVFMPGLAEIQRLHESCAASHVLFKATDNGTYLIALHSALATSESTIAFDKPKNQSSRKIIISTNIAETSITIDDVVYVVDSGKVKEKRLRSEHADVTIERTVDFSSIGEAATWKSWEGATRAVLSFVL